MVPNKLLFISRRFLINKLLNVNTVAINQNLLSSTNIVHTRPLCLNQNNERSSYLFANKSPSCDCPRNFVDINLNCKRFRKKKARNTSTEDEKDEEEHDDGEDALEENPLLMEDIFREESDGKQRLVIDVGSLRLDSFAKTAFGLTRAKVEESFYKGDIYLNGKRPTKKSQDLNIGDEIDMVKQINPEDRNLMDIRRVLIVKMPDKATEQGRMKVTIDRWLNLTVQITNNNE